MQKGPSNCHCRPKKCPATGNPNHLREWQPQGSLPLTTPQNAKEGSVMSSSFRGRRTTLAIHSTHPQAPVERKTESRPKHCGQTSISPGLHFRMPCMQGHPVCQEREIRLPHHIFRIGTQK